jgi:hypothetical protein
MLTLQHIFNFSAVLFLILLTFRVTGIKAVCNRFYAIGGADGRRLFFFQATNSSTISTHVNFIFKGGVVIHNNCF